MSKVPVGLQDVYDTQVDQQLFFFVCFGRDAAHPEETVKYMHRSLRE